uniref:Uncharacterized protein n=1 Tax=Anguilla anguilla TaxID=7936 RepID=A0A0E9TEI7_ANGAN
MASYLKHLNMNGYPLQGIIIYQIEDLKPTTGHEMNLNTIVTNRPAEKIHKIKILNIRFVHILFVSFFKGSKEFHFQALVPFHTSSNEIKTIFICIFMYILILAMEYY